jgi:hypothetical protein
VLFSPNRLVKPLELIPDRHGEGEQLFERVLGGLKVDGDPAGGEIDPSGQVGQGLVDDGGGRLDRDPGLLLPGGA